MPPRRPSTLATVSTVTCLLGLAFALACLYVVGPPPTFRIDSLWVYFHQDAVQLCVAGLVLAGAGTLFGLNRRRTRWILALLWLGAVTAGLAMFSDRLQLIVRVLRDGA